MIFGIPPYYDRCMEKMYENIKFAELKFPKKYKISCEGVDLITKLLNKNPTKRLGASKAGFDEIKSHPFFKDINFEAILNKKVPAPFVPTIKGNLDVQNFDEDFTKECPEVQTYVENKNLIKKNQELFKDFN